MSSIKSVALIIFILSLNSCFFQKQPTVGFNTTDSSGTENNDENGKILSLCVIEKNPEKYDGKTIRLKSRLDFGMENETLSDETCYLYRRAVVTFDDKNAYEPIDKLRTQSSKNGTTLFKVEVEIEGQFINKPFTGCCTNTPYQFKVTKTFSAQLIN